MFFLKFFGLFPLLLCIANSWADTVKINPERSNQYTVVNGKPQLGFPEIVILKPRIRESLTKQAIKIIPANAITQFLALPKVVSEKELAKLPYVVAFPDQRLMVGTGDRVYVRSISAPKSLGYAIYRAGKTYISPETNEILGYEATHIADAIIERTGDPATFYIAKSKSEVRAGDRLMVSTESEWALNYFPRPPTEPINGSIIGVLGGDISQFGQFNIVVIDRGTADGLQIGHTLDIYQRGDIVEDSLIDDTKFNKVKLPNKNVGKVIVFRPFERVSYALVIRAYRVIRLLDSVQTS